MGTFSMDEADNYGKSNAGSFFTLKNDKDTARVRFLYRTMDDVKGIAAHKVDVNGKERYVNCLRSYNEPIDNCPFCKAQYKLIPRIFVKLYNVDTDEFQIWERGKTFFSTLASIANHCNPMCNQVVEVTRNGKAGDQKTTYTTYPIENSAFNLDEFDEVDAMGSIVLQKTASEMNYYIQNGKFEDNGQQSAPQQTAEAPQRRTPTNPNRVF